MGIDSKFVQDIKGMIAEKETRDDVAKKYSDIADKDVAPGKFRAWTNRVYEMDRSVKQVIGAFMLSVCNHFKQSKDYETISCIGDTADVKAKLEALSEFAGYAEIIRGVQHEGDNFSPVIFTMAENLNDKIPKAIINFNTFTLEDIQWACSCMCTNTDNFKSNAPVKKLAFLILLKMQRNLDKGVEMSDISVIESVFKDEGILDADDYLFG